jgi:hypothetical protein
MDKIFKTNYLPLLQFLTPDIVCAIIIYFQKIFVKGIRHIVAGKKQVLRYAQDDNSVRLRGSVSPWWVLVLRSRQKGLAQNFPATGFAGSA